DFATMDKTTLCTCVCASCSWRAARAPPELRVAGGGNGRFIFLYSKRFSKSDSNVPPNSRPAADCLQRPLRRLFRFRQPLGAALGAIMPLATTIIISLFGALVSALIGGVTVWLAIRKRLEEDALGRATRRTTALQLLSEEECTLEQVHDECVAMHTIVTVK